MKRTRALLGLLFVLGIALGIRAQAWAQGDAISRFPPDVQPLVKGLPPKLIDLLLEVRNAGPGTLVWADAGGEFHEGQRRAFHTKWEKITGWKVQSAPQSQTGGIPPDFETKTKTGKPEWDVVELSGYSYGFRFEPQGLFEKLDLSLFPVEKFPKKSLYSAYWVDTLDGSTNLVYNKNVFKDAAKTPKSVLDLFDTARYPGKRCMWSFYDGGALELALMADGVQADQVYKTLTTDEGLQRALKKLDSIKKDLVLVDSGAQSVQFPLDGQCDLGLTWNGRPALRVRDEPTLPLAVVDKDALLWGDPFAIPKGAKSYKAALSALAYALQPANQCEFMNAIGYGVVMDKSCLSDFAAKWGPKADVAALGQSQESIDFYVKHAKRLTEAWNAWKTSR